MARRGLAHGLGDDLGYGVAGELLGLSPHHPER